MVAWRVIFDAIFKIDLEVICAQCWAENGAEHSCSQCKAKGGPDADRRIDVSDPLRYACTMVAVWVRDRGERECVCEKERCVCERRGRGREMREEGVGK